MKTERNDIEKYFEWWIMEMMDYGFIKDFIREGHVITVRSEAPYGRVKRYKRKPNIIEQFNLFQKIEYSYDYKIVWNESAQFIFYEVVDDTNCFVFGKPLFIAHTESEHDSSENIVSYIDVKPTNSVARAGGKVSSAHTFPLKQRLIWETYRLYINKVVPFPMLGTGFKSSLFTKSFTPKRYLLTDKTLKERKIKWKPVSLREFVESQTKRIQEVTKNTKDIN